MGASTIEAQADKKPVNFIKSCTLDAIRLNLPPRLDGQMGS
jgi:hypothetical protein